MVNTEEQIEIPPNQKGAQDKPSELDEYIASEMKMGSIIGPFKVSPVEKQTRISLLDTKHKKD